VTSESPCTAVVDEGLLVSLLDGQLAAADERRVLAHLQDCCDCLLTLGQVLEMHGRVLIDRYWEQVRGFDPKATLG